MSDDFNAGDFDTGLATWRTGPVRRRSKLTLFGLPLYDIATGPDPEKGERRGHARGIIAVGDFATGVLAIGKRNFARVRLVSA